MTEYQKHPSTELNALFAAKPYQGQNPNKAKVIVIGNDANYSEEITKSTFFKFIIEYHVDGVKFWKKYGVHHPFLLDTYPLSKTSGGVPYHRNFKKLGYSSGDAEVFSFIELLNVPTMGITSTNINTFWNLIDIEHLKWLETIIINNKAKTIFLPRTVYSNLLEIKMRYNIFSWLPTIAIKPKGSQTIYNKNKTEIIISYSFSASQIHNELNNIRFIINTFLKKEGASVQDYNFDNSFKENNALTATDKYAAKKTSAKDDLSTNINSILKNKTINSKKIKKNETETLPLDYSCPICRSKSTRKTLLIWAGGISHSNHTSSRIGVFYYGKIGLFGSNSWGKGKKQSKLSELNNPPVFYGLAEFFSVFFVCIGIIPVLLTLFGISAFGGIKLFMALGVFMLIYDIFVYPSEKAEWDESFFCNKCGAQYIPGGKILNNAKS